MKDTLTASARQRIFPVIAIAAGMLLSLLGWTPSLAQRGEQVPVKLIVPFPPGGPTDISARVIAKHLADELDESVVVENRAGAAGTIGTAYVARSVPDGFTLLWGGTSSIVVAPSLYRTLSYQPAESFSPIGLTARGMQVLVGRSDLPPKDLVQLLEYAKGRELTAASAGTGSLGHLAAELFQNRTGTRLLHVPYRGGAQAMTDVMGGQADLIFDTVALLAPQIREGKLRAYAVTGAERDPTLPEIPTISQVIGKDYEAYSWFGLLAPKGIPAERQKRLVDALQRATASPGVNEQLRELGMNAVNGSPEAFSQIIKDDQKKWADVVKSANIPQQ